ncbi:hypothetical protein NFI96_005832 [Prochilodus magdalenae]|nr:hypothetical protein NFI96_005832 [Prochilodus magdalenae]
MDLKNCVERLDLENFDKCHELRSPFKKKHRLVLIAPPKSKVSHVKLQAQNQEERDAWIKALSDGINRAKNKIFDEVKVDEGLSLEHVTRSRPKGNRGRRPPTRIHMKEVANVASDGILRLDLDTADNTPNGTHVLTAETGKPELTPSKSLDNISEEPTPPKKVVKPPMPPTKENKPTESQESEAPQKKVLMPPMPPSKEKKPIEEEEPSEVMQEKKVLNPPMPPSKENKPSESQETEAPQKKVPMPPMPPSKEKTPVEEEEPSEVMQEKKVLNPPMPPSKENKPSISANGDATQEKASDSGVESGAAPTPSISSSAPEETDDTESCEPASPKNTSDPPAPPSKDKKPSQRLSSKKEESLSEEDDVDDKDNKDEVEGVKADSQKAAEEGEEEKEEA